MLASGGVDSTALLADALKRGEEVHPLYVAAGFVWEKAEFARLARICRELASRRLAPPRKVRVAGVRAAYGAHWAYGDRPAPPASAPDRAVYLPGRNALLLSRAAAYSASRGIDRVRIGILKNNPFPDASPAFLAEMESTLSRTLGKKLRIEAPLRASRKKDAVRRLGARVLALTLSCLRPGAAGKPCGACNKCAERERGIREAALASKRGKAKAR